MALYVPSTLTQSITSSRGSNIFMAMIEAENLRKSFGDFEAVCGLSFSIPAREVVGLLGPNGAGKTTTMRLLTTFLPPTSGTARIAGFDICKQAQEVRRRIGYLPETPPIYPELKVNEYLTFAGKLRGLRGTELKRSLERVIDQCALSDVSDKLCGQLSKGFRQRVGLAQALIHDPELVILDEPTSGLDPNQILEMRQLLVDLAKKHTVILSTHILREVEEVCSQVIIIARGRLVVQGSVAELSAGRSLEVCFLEAVASVNACPPKDIPIAN